MPPVTRLLLFVYLLLLTACAGNNADSPLLRAEPEIDSTLARAPRTLRLYYSELPDVSRSSLLLRGPAGDYPLRGLHTMAANDLMVEIMQPLEDGDYRVEWTAVVGEDPSIHSGAYGFTVDSGE